MSIVQYLTKVPSDKMKAIIEEFGGISQLYSTIFMLTREKYNLSMSKPAGHQLSISKIDDQFFDIEDKLDAIDLGVDGHTIVTEVMADHDRIIADKIVKNIQSELAKSGLNYNDVVDWMKKNYGI